MKFEYEKALSEKGIKKSVLPSSITDKIEVLNSKFSELETLSKSTDSKQEDIDKLDKETSLLDSQIANAISKLKINFIDESENPPVPGKKPNLEEITNVEVINDNEQPSDNNGKNIVLGLTILALIGAGFAYGMKYFSGKK